MKIECRNLLLAISAVLLAGTPALRAELSTLHYPTQDESMFSIEAPGEWEVTEIKEVGDFGSLESENGSVLQFRAVELESEEEAKKEIDSIFDSTAKFLTENYTDVQLDEPQEVSIKGQPGAQLTGSGKDKEGNDVKFLSAMIALGPTTIAEIWAAVAHEGNDDLAKAQKILESFKPASN
ncbi:MAG: hypothetical protein IAE97_14355 [Chthoniobacterales bacterium]|nr:hypothetical protein [Chthoniobacterales bacterium]